MKPVTYIVAGAGSRGTGYARFAKENPAAAKLVGVAEPRDIPRLRLVDEHQLHSDNVFLDWKDAAARDKFADAVVISTQDAMHCEPAIAFAEKGYHLLLEKPMAPTAGECQRIVDAVKANGVILAVGHVLLYTEYTQVLRKLIDEGAIGEIVSIQHMEPVGYWHHAHSFVRGNWRNEAESSFMLLAKSCHDLDWIRYIIGQPCQAVSSFGSLTHFRKNEKPPEAGDATRCLDCDFESRCAYSAKKLYLSRLRLGETGWPLDVLTLERTEAGLMEALQTGPYGRCVYECDNDVVDHQVVNMEFAGGKTASFTMTAFCTPGPRRTTIFGTLGELSGNGSEIRITEFLTAKTTTIKTAAAETFIKGDRSSGDIGLMATFIESVATGDASRLLSGPNQTLESHLMVFAAEQSRREGRVVRLGE